MEKKKILYISQEITPYLPESEMSLIGRHLPQGVQERGREIRTFMPRYGSVNERRNQLHEVFLQIQTSQTFRGNQGGYFGFGR